MSQGSMLEFLQTLYPEPMREERLVLWSKPKAGKWSHSDWLVSLRRACELALTYRTARHIYFGVILQNPEKALEIARLKRSADGGPPPRLPLSSVRGSEGSAAVMTAVWVDLDVAGENHRAGHLPPDRDAALGLLEAVPGSPSIVVSTGGGFHVYWLLSEPWILHDDLERAMAGDLVQRVQAAIRRRAEARGWRVDATADLPRVLRLPGTLNHKTKHPLPVEVLELHPTRRYDPSDFDLLPGAGLPGAVPDRSLAVRLQEKTRELDAGPPADFVRVHDGCPWFEFICENQDEVSEEAWYAGLSIAVRCATADADGFQLGHRMSCRYPDYTPQETDAKLAQALREASARTCADIRYRRGGERFCGSCTHWGLLRSPIVLGRGAAPTPPPAGNGGSPPGEDDRVPIIVTTREDEVNDQALAVLADSELNLFERGGVMVEAVRGEVPGKRRQRLKRPPGASRVQPLTEARLRETLARHCAFQRRKRAGEGVTLLPAHPPQWTVRALLARGTWPQLPLLEGLVEGPVLRADGSVLQKAGYDAKSGLYYAPGSAFVPVPEKPSEAEWTSALDRLREVVCDFPFRSDAHLSAWLASLLTPLARFAFEGSSPLNLIDANVRGTGKSLLADVCTTILTGRPAARMSYSRDEEELRKAITSMAVEATQVVLIDNVTGNFGSPTLDRALTAPTWRDRLLGSNVQVEMPLLVTWFATGNNVTLRGDTPRRCLHIRLESPEERPEERSGFAHPRLLRWVSKHRHRLLPAALTLLRAYEVAGRPDQGLTPWGSYEGWSDLVRGALVWLGMQDPAKTREGLESAADPESAARASLVEGLAEVFDSLGRPATAGEMLKELEEPGNKDRYGALRSAFEESFPRLKPGELPTAQSLGMKLRAIRDRVVGGAAVEQLARGSHGTRWKLKRTSDPGGVPEAGS